MFRVEDDLINEIRWTINDDRLSSKIRNSYPEFHNDEEKGWIVTKKDNFKARDNIIDVAFNVLKEQVKNGS